MRLGPRGRADLRVRLRDGEGREAGRAPLDLEHDEAGDPGGLRAPAPGRADGAARAGGAIAVRGRLARRDERDPGGVDPAAGRVRRRRVARARPDADARDRRRAESSRSAASSPSRTGSSRPTSRRPGTREYTGRYLGGKRIGLDDATAIVRDCDGRPGTITKLEKKEETEQPQLLYDLTSLQRHANTLFGFSARRTLAAAQKLYEEHKAITYPRTSSRFLTCELIDEIKPTVALVGENAAYARAAQYVLGLEQPAARPGRERREGRRPPRDHPDTLRARHRAHEGGRAADLRPRRQALPRHLPPGCRVRADARRDDGREPTCSARAGACCSRRAGRPSTARSRPRRQPRKTTRAATSRCRR